MQQDIDLLIEQVERCQLCRAQLPFPPRPVIRASACARLLIIGQAPGLKVQQTGIPWNDASGQRLRQWLGIDSELFYDPQQIAIMPMAFCYPGRGKSGDLPPPKQCAIEWHQQLLSAMPKIELTLLIGQYAQHYYLARCRDSLTERVRNWEQFQPAYWPLPHPSPRNQIWLKRNPWFAQEVLPRLRDRVQKLVG